MNEELKGILNSFAIDLIQKVKSGLDIGIEFASKELPLVAKEYITRGLAREIFYVSMWFILTTFFTIPLLYLFNDKRKHLTFTDDHDGSAEGTCIILLFICAIIFLIMTFISTYNLISIAVAPRVYLLEQLKNLITSTTTSGL